MRQMSAWENLSNFGRILFGRVTKPRITPFKNWVIFGTPKTCRTWPNDVDFLIQAVTFYSVISFPATWARNLWNFILKFDLLWCSLWVWKNWIFWKKLVFFMVDNIFLLLLFFDFGTLPKKFVRFFSPNFKFWAKIRKKLKKSEKRKMAFFITRWGG